MSDTPVSNNTPPTQQNTQTQQPQQTPQNAPQQNVHIPNVGLTVIDQQQPLLQQGNQEPQHPAHNLMNEMNIDAPTALEAHMTDEHGHDVNFDDLTAANTQMDALLENEPGNHAGENHVIAPQMNGTGPQFPHGTLNQLHQTTENLPEVEQAGTSLVTGGGASLGTSTNNVNEGGSALGTDNPATIPEPALPLNNNIQPHQEQINAPDENAVAQPEHPQEAPAAGNLLGVEQIMPENGQLAGPGIQIIENHVQPPPPQGPTDENME